MHSKGALGRPFCLLVSHGNELETNAVKEAEVAQFEGGDDEEGEKAKSHVWRVQRASEGFGGLR